MDAGDMGPVQKNEAAYAALEDTEQVNEASVEALIVAWAHTTHQTIVLANAQSYAVGLVQVGGVVTIGDLRALLDTDVVDLCGTPRMPARRMAEHFRTAYRGGRRAVDAGFEADSGPVSDPNPDPNEGRIETAVDAEDDNEDVALDMGPVKSPNATESEGSAAVAALMANSTAQGELMVQVVQAHAQMVKLQTVAAEGAALKAASKVKELNALEFPKARMRPEWIPFTNWLRDIQGKYQDLTNFVDVIEMLIHTPHALTREALVATVEPEDDRKHHMAVRVAIGAMFNSIYPTGTMERSAVGILYDTVHYTLFMTNEQSLQAMAWLQEQARNPILQTENLHTRFTKFYNRVCDLQHNVLMTEDFLNEMLEGILQHFGTKWRTVRKNCRYGEQGGADFQQYIRKVYEYMLQQPATLGPAQTGPYRPGRKGGAPKGGAQGGTKGGAQGGTKGGTKGGSKGGTKGGGRGRGDGACWDFQAGNCTREHCLFSHEAGCPRCGSAR
jgi:hypothetical protein